MKKQYQAASIIANQRKTDGVSVKTLELIAGFDLISICRVLKSAELV